ncbi:hypothetical protein BT69DRAFT_1329162 [Atractiella rhizophila]|nr:hypothetical protein BT69DRAFT_1329162 [Atractiella rhizophila]
MVLLLTLLLTAVQATHLYFADASHLLLRSGHFTIPQCSPNITHLHDALIFTSSGDLIPNDIPLRYPKNTFLSLCFPDGSCHSLEITSSADSSCLHPHLLPLEKRQTSSPAPTPASCAPLSYSASYSSLPSDTVSHYTPTWITSPPSPTPTDTSAQATAGDGGSLSATWLTAPPPSQSTGGSGEQGGAEILRGMESRAVLVTALLVGAVMIVGWV